MRADLIGVGLFGLIMAVLSTILFYVGISLGYVPVLPSPLNFRLCFADSAQMALRTDGYRTWLWRRPRRTRDHVEACE